MRKGADTATMLDGIHAMVKRLNEHILPPGVKIVPYLDRDDLVHYTTHTVLHNLAEGMIAGRHHPVPFSGERSRRHYRFADHSVRVAVCVHLSGPAAHLRQPAFAGRAGLRHGGGWSRGDGGKHRPPSATGTDATPRTLLDRIREAAHEVQRPVFYAIAIIITAYLPIFTLQRVEGKLFKPMAWTVAFALLGALIFSMLIAPALASLLFRTASSEWQNPVMEFLTAHYRRAVRWAIRHRWVTVGRRRASCS